MVIYAGDLELLANITWDGKRHAYKVVICNMTGKYPVRSPFTYRGYFHNYGSAMDYVNRYFKAQNKKIKPSKRGIL